MIARLRWLRDSPSAGWACIAALLAGAGLIALAAGESSRAAAALAVQAGCLGAIAWCCVHDITYYRIPSAVTFPALAGMLLATPLWPDRSPFFAPLGALVFGGVMLAAYLLWRGRGMGDGDIALAALAGALAGPTPLAVWAFLFGAFVPAGLYAIVLLLRGRSRADTFPFGPFVGVGAVTAVWLA